MKSSRRMIDRGWTRTVTTLLVVAFPLVAAAATQNDSGSEISDEKLRAVAEAYIEVYQINQSYKSKIEAAQTAGEADQLQQAANQEMVDAIENAENVSVNEYNDIIQALGEDDELRERLQAQVDEIQEEESERE